MKCKHCGNEVQETWNLCPFCCSPIEKKKLCPKCGAELQPNWAVCPFCGENISASIEPLTPTLDGFDVLPSTDNFDVLPNIDDTAEILPNVDVGLPNDFDLDLVAGDIDEAKEREKEQQNAEYNKKLNLARIACIRKNFEEAYCIYDDLITENPEDVNAYIGFVRVVSKNYSVLEGAEIDEAIMVAMQVTGNKDLSKCDKDFAEYYAKRKAHLDAIAEAELKAKQEAERKAKEAERKAKEAERKAKEAEKKAREEANRKAKEEAKRKAQEEAERRAKEEAERRANKKSSQQELDEMYNYGLALYDNNEFASALAYFAECAEQGHAGAQYMVGRYYCGLVLEEDPAKAAEWFARSAEQGNPDALYELGMCFKNGYGVARNPAFATQLIEKASELGNIDATIEIIDETIY